ncbi:hypothetical protein O97_00246 [Bartonella henselae str. Zeus]|nr:hypothetical protein Q653_00636 [Bartonella henselae JK 42]ETS12592.1 hypothetical protein Q652_00766 [Bartonella henselae JK 41]KEC58348.1 hypothetical protein O97_00246 [Bartonella henselae str. Zeus]KEC61265.1 hypothetical protein O95_00216 [Bartonella henselae JK 53]
MQQSAPSYYLSASKVATILALKRFMRGIFIPFFTGCIHMEIPIVTCKRMVLFDSL